MDELRKINSMQLYYLWRNLALSLLCIGLVMGGVHILPFYMAPALSLFLCAGLYTMIWNNNGAKNSSCMVIPETMLYSLLGYSFISIVLVVTQVLGLYHFPNDIIFFNDPFLPSLILLPTALVVSAFALFFKRHLPTYKQFRLHYGGARERGYFGLMTNSETNLQLRNMVGIFAVLTAIVWYYYLNEYVSINQNGRDWYVFLWIVVIAVILDEVYFMIRYFNLYLDLQEHNEIITPEELRDVTAHTFLRFYVICGEYIYINKNALDRLNNRKGIYDTPFITKRTVNGIPISDVKKIVERMTGKENGELRFFFGRHLAGIDKHSLLRYFYFLDGDISDYSDMCDEGEWVHFDDIKRIYNTEPLKLGTNALNDLNRLSTIILTEKTYDEEGNRKNKIKSYKATLTLADVRNSQLDFQDDKWMHIADFNSDIKFFKLKKFLRGASGKDSGKAYHKKY